MTEAYFDDPNTRLRVYQDKQSGQSFIPVEDHTLQCVDLDYAGPTKIRTPRVEVFTADQYGFPYGEKISHDRWWQDPFYVESGRKRVRCQMSPVIVYAGTRYVIIMTHYPPLPPDYAYWYYNQGGGDYPRGMRISSTDAGLTWSQHPNDDHMFSEFGPPYSPPSPPPPPIYKWMVVDIAYYPWPGGLKLVVTTNVPCHLYMYWTLHEPLKHVEARLRRGTPFSDDLRYCFVDFHENQQEEPGDTLFHTFYKLGWVVCETRWFVFRAEINGSWSTSESPIFKYHREEERYCRVILERWTY